MPSQNMHFTNAIVCSVPPHQENRLFYVVPLVCLQTKTCMTAIIFMTRPLLCGGHLGNKMADI